MRSSTGSNVARSTQRKPGGLLIASVNSVRHEAAASIDQRGQGRNLRQARRPRRRAALRRSVHARVEQAALRGGLRRADVAEGVRRRGRAVQLPGDPLRRARRRPGSAPHRRDRPRHGRADDHRARHRRAEGALPPAASRRRGDLVPGLLGAGRGLRPRRRAHARRAPAATSTSSTARRSGRRSRTSPTSASSSRRATPRRRATGTSRTSSSTCTRPASRCARCARSPARRSSTRSSSATSRCRSRTGSATRETAGRSR